jgi:glycosyltransferase involved in cell wall biosynthesis
MIMKKILVVSSFSLFPKVMANQDRIIEMIRRLSENHSVDVSTVIRNDQEYEESGTNLKEICRRFYPIRALNPVNSQVRRKYYGLKFRLHRYLFAWPLEYFYNKHYYEQIGELHGQNDYDIIQVEYWFMGGIFEQIDKKAFKVIDTHDVAISRETLIYKSLYGRDLSYLRRRELAEFERLERRILRSSDLLISITRDDFNTLRTMLPDNDNIVIPTGQNIEYFSTVKTDPEPRTILFYGSMVSEQNIQAFFRLWNGIMPRVKAAMPDAKVLVVGSHPPESIQSLHNGEDVIITGFVGDIRDYLPRAYLMAIPLEIGAGFRSRIVEVMAMGIPVIGTHNALDSTGMQDAVHGYITDDDEEIASRMVYLMNNREKRDDMANQCRKFVNERYSIEATFGKLSDYYSNLEI